MDQELKFDLVEDIRNNPEFIALMVDDNFCSELWSAFANLDWYKKFDPRITYEDQVMFLLKEDLHERSWGASFRGMGGVIANLRNEFHGKSEDYMDWYCSGPYASVSDRVYDALTKLGWEPLYDENDN